MTRKPGPKKLTPPTSVFATDPVKGIVISELELGTDLRAYFSPDFTGGFPIEVEVSTWEEPDGFKVWCFYVPDLGSTMLFPYWDSEGKVAHFPKL